MRLRKKLLLIGLPLGLTVHMAIGVGVEEDPVYGRVGNFIIKKSERSPTSKD